VNVIFTADPQLIAKPLKFKLDPEVYRQNYQRLAAKKRNRQKKLAKAK
jgi:hypothetical protein